MTIFGTQSILNFKMWSLNHIMSVNFWYTLKTPCFMNSNPNAWHVTTRMHGPLSKIQIKSSFSTRASQRKHNHLQIGCHKYVKNEVYNLRMWKMSVRESHKWFFTFQKARYFLLMNYKVLKRLKLDSLDNFCAY